jgi:hypothetical protein
MRLKGVVVVEFLIARLTIKCFFELIIDRIIARGWFLYRCSLINPGKRTNLSGMIS